jgi:uncharacterized protein (DUF885 family)
MAGMSAKVGEYFLKIPQTPYDVRRLAPELEGAMTFGFYQPPSKSEPTGIYFYNGSNPGEKSLLWAAGLLYHELVPGHHFHIASQYENEDLPPYRRESSFNAYTEGWAEYASWLAEEMELFTDLYDLCGKHVMDLFLSTRLVVDTGMNYYKWPRKKAVEFMRENLIESEVQIQSESLRYSVDMPGQALGYKLGSIKMLELREKAEKALGEKFDIKKFHQAVLGSGAMPFPVLEKHIDWYIKKELEASK